MELLAAAPASGSVVRGILFLHVLFGFAAFAFAPVALVTAKGKAAHRRWGRWYFWAMAGVAATALVLSLVLPIVFLGLVSVFSFYAAFAAYRVLSLKDLARGGHGGAIDWAAGGVTFVASLALLVLGVTHPQLMGKGVVPIAGRPVSVVAVAFGLLGMGLAAATLKDFVFRPRDPMFWWFAHLRGMVGSYIAAWTAFSAVNLTPVVGPVWWVWLWPTLVGTPLIVLWSTYYHIKFAARKRKPAPEEPAVASSGLPTH